MGKTIKQQSTGHRLESSRRRIKTSSLRYGKTDPLTAQTFLDFIYTHDRVSSHLNMLMRRHGMTRAGINVLVILRSCEQEGCHQQALSQQLLVSRANVTGLVDGLIRKGLATRIADKNDRRACIVKILPKGKKSLDSILPLHHDAIAAIFSGLNNKEKKAFSAIMAKLRLVIDTLEQKDEN